MGLIDLVQTLTSPHPLDRYLELVRPTLTVRDMRAEITHVRRSASDSVTLTLRPTRQWSGHRAGQYVQIGVVIDGVKHTRCYSPVDPQGRRDRHLQLTIKAHPHGLVSRYLHRHAAPGIVVDLAPAAGTFALPESVPERMLLISGGSGITPVLSMLRTLADQDYRGTLVFLHYAKSPEAVPHRAELDDIAQRHNNFHIELRYPSLSVGERLGLPGGDSGEEHAGMTGGRAGRAGTSAPGVAGLSAASGAGGAEGASGAADPDGASRAAGGADALWSCAAPARPVGHFDYDTLEHIAPWFAAGETFVCGPGPLMDAVRRVYEAEGLDDRLHTEEFTLSTVPVDAADVTGSTTFSASGVQSANEGASLLDQAESAGLTPEYGCRMGICFSCTAVRRSGCTRNLRTGELDADDDQPIQLCINAAVGDVDIEI
ncbi:ferredoxin reductase [Nocardia mexicana]|uniref:Flavin-dependent oxidoreductase n=1 Tax=Nocardia mexicana TaxID=279262 RepID=A0A370HCZ5_9NOCA|nr:FAD-binding oxidoreductase [Nocardia mexicana]RDI54650.1 flavin-dependent oxidoreductase [Nocardia mexicana]